MKNFYLYYGDDKSILNTEINNFKKDINVSDDDIVYYDISEIGDIVNEAETISMFSNKKLLIIDCISYFSEKKDISNIKLLEDYFDNYNSNSYLLFVANCSSIDSRKKITKLISSKGIVKKIEVTDNYLIDYAINYLKKEGYEFSKLLATYLINKCGDNIDNLSNELDKLMLYRIDDKVITKDDINLLIEEKIDDSVFDMVGSIIKKDTSKAIRLYNNFILNGMDASQIINLLASQFRLLFQVKRLYNQGKSNDEIAKILEFKSVYRVKYLLGDSYYYTEEDLLKYLKLLANLDHDIKFGLVDGNTGLQLLIAKKDI